MHPSLPQPLGGARTNPQTFPTLLGVTQEVLQQEGFGADTRNPSLTEEMCRGGVEGGGSE